VTNVSFLVKAVVISTALVFTACSGAPQSASQTAINRPPLGTPLPPLTKLNYPPVSTKVAPVSSIPVFVAVDRRFIHDAVERWVPRRLHEEKGREVGPGTTLDLTVTRQDPHFNVKDDTFFLELPLRLFIDVKSRLGPLSLNLGHCEPEIVAKAQFPTQLRQDLRLKEPDLTLELTSACRLSGFDVSDLLHQELGKQQKRAKREINEGVERAARILEKQIQKTTANLDANDSSCPRFSPVQLVQSPVEESNGVFSLSLNLRGSIVHGCALEAPELKTVVHERQRLPFDVVESTLIDWVTLSRELDPILRQHGLEVTPHQLLSVATPSGDRIALGVSGEKTNGWVFLTAQVQNGMLRLVALESDNPPLREQLQSLLVGFTLPVDVNPLVNLGKRLFTQTTQYSVVQVNDPSLASKLTLTVDELETAIVTEIVSEGVALRIHLREPLRETLR
jgi:hypothetical protein